MAGALMIVEDDEDLQPLLEFTFEKEGYEVSVFGDGASALTALEEGASPDCIVLDLMMPGVDGLDFLESRTGTEYEDIPVIVLTAWDADDAVEQAFEHGADDYVAKPFSPNELVLRVRRLLR